jgi:hypothetical protein
MNTKRWVAHIAAGIVLALAIVLAGYHPAVAAPTGTHTEAWLGEYYTNADLVGGPALTRRDPAIDFDWGTSSPATGIPAETFSVRWTRIETFADGYYLFRATVDDGIRVYIDGALVIDEWRDDGRREVTAERRLEAGRHALRVEYYERGGAAVARFGWEDVTPSTLNWRGEYWANLWLSGTPAMVRTDQVLAFDWGQKSPGGSIPKDGFSARWTRRVYFDAGTYVFHVLVDDGMRLWVNNRLILDAWTDHDSVELAVSHALSEGIHTLKVEYYERIGNARIWVWWEEAQVSAYPQWKGEYWSNRILSGTPVLVRNDRDINFEWGKGPPSPSLPRDDFSVRWTREVPLESDLYRFHILSDDGIRLWIDGRLHYDAWRDQEARDTVLDLNMTKGRHEIKVEYYEHAGDARVHVWWERISWPIYLDWRGEYWPNRDLSGSPLLVRNDANIGFYWGTAAPANGLPSDNFSVRWSRRVDFLPGRYRFYAVADDGIRVRLDGGVIMDEWHDSSGKEVYTADVSVGGARHVGVEYYERGGDAQVHFWWTRIGD